MPVYTKTPEVVYEPTANGVPRGPDMLDAGILAREMITAQEEGDATLAAAITAGDAANAAAIAAVDDRVDELQDQVASGVRWTPEIIRVRATGNTNRTTALENGDTLNGVTLATGDHVFLGAQTTPSQNGIYTVVASGAASRATFADSAAELANMGFVIREGTVGAGERWVLSMAAEDITVDTTALNYSLIAIEPGYGAEITAARDGETTLGDRLDNMQDEIDAAAAADVSGRFPTPLDIDFKQIMETNDGDAVAGFDENGMFVPLMGMDPKNLSNYTPYAPGYGDVARVITDETGTDVMSYLDDDGWHHPWVEKVVRDVVPTIVATDEEDAETYPSWQWVPELDNDGIHLWWNSILQETVDGSLAYGCIGNRDSADSSAGVHVIHRQRRGPMYKTTLRRDSSSDDHNAGSPHFNPRPGATRKLAFFQGGHVPGGPIYHWQSSTTDARDLEFIGDISEFGAADTLSYVQAPTFHPTDPDMEQFFGRWTENGRLVAHRTSDGGATWETFSIFSGVRRYMIPVHRADNSGWELVVFVNSLVATLTNLRIVRFGLDWNGDLYSDTGGAQGNIYDPEFTPINPVQVGLGDVIYDGPDDHKIYLTGATRLDTDRYAVGYATWPFTGDGTSYETFTSDMQASTAKNYYVEFTTTGGTFTAGTPEEICPCGEAISPSLVHTNGGYVGGILPMPLTRDGDPCCVAAYWDAPGSRGRGILSFFTKVGGTTWTEKKVHDIAAFVGRPMPCWVPYWDGSEVQYKPGRTTAYVIGNTGLAEDYETDAFSDHNTRPAIVHMKDYSL